MFFETTKFDLGISYLKNCFQQVLLSKSTRIRCFYKMFSTTSRLSLRLRSKVINLRPRIFMLNEPVVFSWLQALLQDLGAPEVCEVS